MTDSIMPFPGSDAAALAVSRVLVGLLATYFPTPVLPTETMEVWARELSEAGCSEPDMREGVRLVARTVKGRPVAIADLLEACLSVRRHRESYPLHIAPDCTDEQILESTAAFGMSAKEQFSDYWDRSDPTGERRARFSGDKIAATRLLAAKRDKEWRERQGLPPLEAKAEAKALHPAGKGKR